MWSGSWVAANGMVVLFVGPASTSGETADVEAQHPAVIDNVLDNLPQLVFRNAKQHAVVVVEQALKEEVEGVPTTFRIDDPFHEDVQCR